MDTQTPTPLLPVPPSAIKPRTVLVYTGSSIAGIIAREVVCDVLFWDVQTAHTRLEATGALFSLYLCVILEARRSNLDEILEIIRLIRCRDYRIPVIVFSTENMESAKQDLIVAGANSVVSNAALLDGLYGAIRHHVNW